MQEQLNIAIELALKAHEGQLYGKLPYITHLVEVDALVVKAYCKNIHSGPYSKEPGDYIDCLRAIAFLHDIIEDTETTVNDLTDAGICEDVALAVVKLTKTSDESYEDYIDAVNSFELARKVKLCDTAANLMNSIKEGNTKRINKYSKQIELLGGF